MSGSNVRRAVGRLLHAWPAALLLVMSPAAHGQSENMTLLGQRDAYSFHSGVWGFTHANGTELGIIGTQNGTSFVNVTNPATPVEVAFITGPSSTWREIRTWQNYAYISTEGGGGIQIVNMNNPLSPTLVGNYSAAFSTCHSLNLDEQTGNLYCNGTNNGLVILSLANPTLPVVAGTYGACYVHDSYVRDGIAYFASIFDCDLMVADVSSLPVITILAEVHYPGAAVHNMWLTADGNYLLTTDETTGGHIRVWDVSSPSAPIQVAQWTNPEEPNSSVHNVTVRGNFAYISWYTAGVQILDLSNPLFPDRAGYYDTYPGSGGFDGNWGVYPFLASGHVLASDMSTGLYIFGFTPIFGTLDGTVRDAATSAPLLGVTVTIPAASRSVTTDNSGYYRVNLAPGNYDVTYELFGYATGDENVSVAQGVTTTRDVDLARLPSGRLDGVVANAGNGQPLGGADVKVLATPLQTTTAVDGSYSFPTLPVGVYTVQVSLFGFGSRIAHVLISADQTTVRDFFLDASFFADNAETNQGWTLGAAGDNASTGIWIRDDPVGTGGGAVQPEDDHTATPGVRCFVTGNCAPGCGIGDNDVDGGRTTLLSPVFNLTGLSNPVLSYWRWYTNNAGNAPNTDTWVVDISSNGGSTWTNLESTTETRASWDRKEFVIRDHITPSGSVRLRMIASDLGDGSIVEAAVDDIEIFEAQSPTAAPEGPPTPWTDLLLPNAPNPLKERTMLRIRLMEGGPVSLEILDLPGRRLRRLLAGQGMGAGSHSIPWDGRDDSGRPVANGVYWQRMVTSRGTQTRPLIVVH